MFRRFGSLSLFSFSLFPLFFPLLLLENIESRLSEGSRRRSPKSRIPRPPPPPAGIRNSYSNDIFARCWLPSATSRCTPSVPHSLFYYHVRFFLCTLLCEWLKPRPGTKDDAVRRDPRFPSQLLLCCTSWFPSTWQPGNTPVMPGTRMAPNWLSQKWDELFFSNHPSVKLHNDARLPYRQGRWKWCKRQGKRHVYL